MKVNLFVETLCLAFATLSTQVQANPFTAAFPSSSSTVVATGQSSLPTGQYGYFFSVANGDSIQQTFTGTGLSSVSQLNLNFAIINSTLSSGNAIDWNVFVNNIQVGSWVWSNANGKAGTFNESYSFPDIAGGGTYNIAMRVSNEVPIPRGGSIVIGSGTMTLNGSVEPFTSVPDGGLTIAMLGMGISGLALIRRKLQG